MSDRVPLLLTYTLLLISASAVAQVSGVSRKGAAPDKFREVLAQIIKAAEEDHLESLIGKRDPEDPDPRKSFFPKVILPGFGNRCRIRLTEDKPTASNGRTLTVEQTRENRSLLYDARWPEYECTLTEDQHLTPSVKKAFERLVERVVESTDLPSTSFDTNSTAEDRPGSGVFVPGRITRFQQLPTVFGREP
jgi:hypothetical protein